MKRTLKHTLTQLTRRVRALPRPTLVQGLLILGLFIFLALVIARTYGLIVELTEVRKARVELEQKRGQLEERHRTLESQVRLIEHPDNLETELRTRFNYKKPGEQVIVVVPPEERP